MDRRAQHAALTGCDDELPCDGEDSLLNRYNTHEKAGRSADCADGPSGGVCSQPFVTPALTFALRRDTAPVRGWLWIGGGGRG
jgi:hypothetical protein